MPARQKIRTLIEWIKRVVTEPRSELTRYQRRARDFYDLLRFGTNQLREDNAPQMAGALAFRTLFGLLPVTIVGAILVRALRPPGSFDAMMRQVMNWLFQDGGDGSLTDELISTVSQASQVNLAALGWVGAAVLIYSGVGLMVAIENSFNEIYRAAGRRSWFRRLPVYWMVLTLGPLAIALTLYLNTRLHEAFASLGIWQWVLTAASVLGGFAVLWLVMTALYLLLPATNVSFRAALVGAFVAAVLLSVGQRFLGAYISGMQSVQLWGSLGFVPLFMFWVYLMWLAVLLGLEVSMTIQTLDGRRLETLAGRGYVSGVVDPAAVVPLMEVVVEEFAAGRTSTSRHLSEVTGIREETVRAMVDGLADAGFVHHVGSDAITLARPPEQIRADALIEVGYKLVGTGEASHSSVLLERLRGAQRRLASEATLAHDLPEG